MVHAAGDRSGHAAKLTAGVDEPSDSDAVTRQVDLLVARLHPDADAAFLKKQVSGGPGPCDNAFGLETVAFEGGRSKSCDLHQWHERRIKGRRRRCGDSFDVIKPVDDDDGAEELAAGVSC